MNGKTRLSEALAYGPAVLEYVISLNKHDFERLRSPLLFKVMPPRISLSRVAAIANIPEKEFLAKLNELAGLSMKESESQSQANEPLPCSPVERPSWLKELGANAITWVDVTSIDDKQGDPMPPINIAVNASKAGQTVGIKHRWEPQPFYDIWHSRGFQFFSEQIEPDLWQIYVHRPLP